jgi:hypothetical protein
MTGLLVLQEIFNLSDDQAVNQLRYDIRFAVALNVPEISDKELYISARTYDYFVQKCRENNLANVIFNETTDKLIDEFNVGCEFQRLDSVHIKSNMTKRSRLGLLSGTAKKFLKSLKSEDPDAFYSLPKGIIDRYSEVTSNGLSYFGSIQPNKRNYALAEVAKDMCQLKIKFEATPSIAALEEFQLLVRVFNDQCQLETLSEKDKLPVMADGIEAVNEDSHSNDRSDSEVSLANCNNIPITVGYSDAFEVKVSLKPPKEVSPESVQSPTDPDAGYSAHKGTGYQAQITETHFSSTTPGTPDLGKPQLRLISYVIVESAAAHDANAVAPILEGLTDRGIKPKELTADTSYGGDENYVFALSNGVDLISPVSGREPGKTGQIADVYPETTLSLAEMAQIVSMSKEYWLDMELYPSGQVHIQDTVSTIGPDNLAGWNSDRMGRILSCQMGQVPETKRNANDSGGTAYFDRATCLGCPKQGECLVKISANQAKLTYTDAKVRLAKRRAFQNTKAFKDKYRKRSGIEATNSELARLGLKKLRVRRLKAVTLKVKLKALALNSIRVIRFLCRKSVKMAANT